MRTPFLIFVIFLFGVSALRATEPPFGVSVRFEQRIGEKLPLSTVFRDSTGRPHVLGDYFHGKPVVLYFGYARCPQLCSIVADGTVAALRQIRPEAGRDFEVVSLSIDPGETTEENKSRQTDAVRRYGRAGVSTGWNFLTGAEPSIRAVTEAVGFYYIYDSRSRQFAHPSGFVVVTTAGVVSRYFPGVDFIPVEVAQAINLAARGETGHTVYDLLLLCFRGDGISGRYGPLIWRVLTVAVAGTILALGGGIGWMLRNERRQSRRIQEGAP